MVATNHQLLVLDMLTHCLRKFGTEYLPSKYIWLRFQSNSKSENDVILSFSQLLMMFYLSVCLVVVTNI